MIESYWRTQEQIMVSSWREGGEVDGKQVTDERLLEFWRERRDSMSPDDPMWDYYDQQYDQFKFAIEDVYVGNRKTLFYHDTPFYHLVNMNITSDQVLPNIDTALTVTNLFNTTRNMVGPAFVSKDEDGEAAAFELTELDPEVREGLENMGVEVQGLFNDDDLAAAAEELEPNSSAALLVWENVWAKGVAEALRNAGGEVFDFGRTPHEVVQAAREYALANA